MPPLPPPLLLDPLLTAWLREDIGRGDRTTQGILGNESPSGIAHWVAKEAGVIAGLPIAHRVFQLLDPALRMREFVSEGEAVEVGKVIAQWDGSLGALLSGERVALNLVMRLSGIATMTRAYVNAIADLPTQLVDTRKTTPGLRILEKYATQVGGAVNHRLGLDDGVMIKDNHIQAAGGIGKAIILVRKTMPYPLTIEVETSDLAQVEEAIHYGADIIMLDNMDLGLLQQCVAVIRKHNPLLKIEASGNVTLKTLRAIAETGVDHISSSAPITRSTWLDLSMRLGG
jgi:nicotinate-nucleotide pyrophosphorylase (carboxylating)